MLLSPNRTGVWHISRSVAHWRSAELPGHRHPGRGKRTITTQLRQAHAGAVCSLQEWGGAVDDWAEGERKEEEGRAMPSVSGSSPPSSRLLEGKGLQQGQHGHADTKSFGWRRSWRRHTGEAAWRLLGVHHEEVTRLQNGQTEVIKPSVCFCNPFGRLFNIGDSNTHLLLCFKLQF